MKKLLLFLLTALLSTNLTQANSVELEWKVSNDKNIKEYRLTCGSEAGVTSTLTIGKVNSWVVSDLKPGRTYWFQITPVSIRDEFGIKSNVIYYKVPVIKVDELNIKPELKIKSVNK